GLKENVIIGRLIPARYKSEEEMIAVPADVKAKLDMAFEDGGLDADDTAGLSADLNLMAEDEEDEKDDVLDVIDHDASDDV
ncbi:MAG: hypothetical protein PHE50_06990, partial [Dehalococcoidales bacterium]|nr:hypothetical protein [Dehalococcoidales bacterium]